MLRRLTAALAVVALVPLTATVTPGGGADAAAPHHPRYRASIAITAHGIPHVTADDFGSLGFGSGYAATQDSVCTLADTLVTARGERSRWFGPTARYNDQVTLQASNLQVDAFVADLHQRRVVEKLLRDPVRGPGPEAKAMVRGYVAGANRWLRTHTVTDPACRGAGYLKPDVTPLDLWYGVYLANLLASAGVFVKEIVDAAPPSPDDPGLPELPVRASQVDRDALLTALGRDPEAPFGSNATAVGGAASTTGKGMLLGNPHFPWRGRYHFTQQHLTIPGRYDVAGASLIGSPVVNIGWNKDVAWSHTVSTAYRFTPYEYKTPGPGTTYLTDAGPQELVHDTVTVTVRKEDGSLGTVEEDLYRTPEGYVVDSPATLMPWGPTSLWAIRDANGEQLRTIDTFLDMGKATSVRDLLRRQDRAGGMPWVNTTAADRHGDVLYADHSVVPNVPDDLVQQCLTPTGAVLQQVAGLPGLDGTFAGGRCAWRTDADAERPGIFGPANLPMEVRRDWVMNANDSYWLPNPEQPLEGYAGIIGCERCVRTMRTRMVAHYVMDRLASGHKESPRSLRGHEHENRVMAAEVMREGGALDQVCQATGETEACQVLHDWDGTSNTDAVGTQIFEEFVSRLPTLPVDAVDPVWLTPFDPADPLNTPRDLNVANPQVVQAMSDAIASLRDQGIAFDATWGSLQVAGDRGAPPVPLGGGTGDAAGNANALASRWPRDNRDHYRPITYGSSHIQAVSFLPGGRVDARTILTYGQSEDPRSPYSSDQTRMFGRQQWVHFAWTDAQIAHDLVRRFTVTG
ncbi:penicillin acylase family protein [Nocardioides sp.]|uniref:penicillin acylase family protein n=1 Tax=Nocardioides sp. TaxID=35761 RepID=UPI003783E5B6